MWKQNQGAGKVKIGKAVIESTSKSLGGDLKFFSLESGSASSKLSPSLGRPFYVNKKMVR